MCAKNQKKGLARIKGDQLYGHFRISLGRILCLLTPRPRDYLVTLRDRNVSSPLSSLALRTSSDTRRTELRRAARSALGTSKRTKYSRWGLPATGLWAGRVSKWWILASNVFGSKNRMREKERYRWRGSNGDQMKTEGER